MQIRTRLTLRFIAIAASILAMVHLYVYEAFKTQTEDTVFDNLQSQAELVIKTSLRNEQNFHVLPPVNAENDADTLPYRDNLSLYNNAYERVFTMHPEVGPITTKTLQSLYLKEKKRFRHLNLQGIGLLANAPSGRQYLVVAEGYCDPSGLIQLRNILIISLLLGIFAVATGGWYFAGQALAPVNRIMQQVEAILPNDLSKRVHAGENKDELARLSETFNRLLDRVEHAFKMQKQFLSNVSHELKNPLTVVRTQLDVALQRERTPQEYQVALASVLDDVHGMAEVQDKLLQLARVHTESAQFPKSPIRLDETIWNAREQLLKINAEYRAKIEFGDLPEDGNILIFEANEPLLRTALLNLMENACKYSSDKQVLLRIYVNPSAGPILEVCNNGEAIAKEELTMIFQPFYRSPKHLQQKGTGIGLSLTDSILRLHGIVLEVESSALAGTVFRMRFPRP